MYIAILFHFASNVNAQYLGSKFMHLAAKSKFNLLVCISKKQRSPAKFQCLNVFRSILA